MFFITGNSEFICNVFTVWPLNPSLLILIDVFVNHPSRGEHGSGNTLESCGISDGSTVHFSLSTFSEEVLNQEDFFTDDVVPSVQQTPKGISVFLSTLYIIVRCV